MEIWRLSGEAPICGVPGVMSMLEAAQLEADDKAASVPQSDQEAEEREWLK